MQTVHNNIVRMQQHFFKYINKKRKIALLLKKENNVYLFTKNFKVKKSNKKLNHVKVRSFFIKKIKGLRTYELNLFKEIKVFSVFDILLLKSIDLSTSIQKKFHFEPNDKELYTMKRILTRKDQQYLIKWKEYSHSNNTWELFKNLMNYQQHLKKFHQQKKDCSISIKFRVSIRQH